MTFTAVPLTLYPDMFPGRWGTAWRAARSKPGCGRARRCRSATLPRTSIAPSTIPRRAAGAGMVLKADVLAAAVDHASAAHPDLPILAMTPRGRRSRSVASGNWRRGRGRSSFAGGSRVSTNASSTRAPSNRFRWATSYCRWRSGGAAAARRLHSAQLPGVMGAASSGDDESFEDGLLEYPHYTRPVTWEGRTIPRVLRSGDHAKIDAWRKRQAETDTRLRRPDLWERHVDARDRPASGARRKERNRAPDTSSRRSKPRKSPRLARHQAFVHDDTLRVGVKVVEATHPRPRFRRRVHRALEQGAWAQLPVRKMSFGEGVRARLPALFAQHRFDYRRPQGRRPSCEALLSAWAHG